jgi:hypothetical protein
MVSISIRQFNSMSSQSTQNIVRIEKTMTLFEGSNVAYKDLKFYASKKLDFRDGDSHYYSVVYERIEDSKMILKGMIHLMIRDGPKSVRKNIGSYLFPLTFPDFHRRHAYADIYNDAYGIYIPNEFSEHANYEFVIEIFE